MLTLPLKIAISQIADLPFTEHALPLSSFFPSFLRPYFTSSTYKLVFSCVGSAVANSVPAFALLCYKGKEKREFIQERRSPDFVSRP